MDEFKSGNLVTRKVSNSKILDRIYKVVEVDNYNHELVILKKGEKSRIRRRMVDMRNLSTIEKITFFIHNLKKSIMIKNFEEEKKELVNENQILLEKYDGFTKNVSPKCWRTSGHHHSELRKMMEEANDFIEITDEEKEIVKSWEK